MLIQRLGSRTQKDPRFIDEFLAAALRHKGSVDEVWLASDYGYPPLEKTKENVRILKEVSEKFKQAGISVSLQISNTLGHGDYNANNDFSGVIYENSPVEHMVGDNGQVSRFCFCYNGEHFRNYIFAAVREYAQLLPRTVFIDDDLRADGHDPRFCCFCDNCLGLFNKKHNSGFSREALVEEINYGELVWRKRWVEFLQESLYDFTYRLVREFVSVSPDTVPGFQHTMHGGYTGNTLHYITKAMKDASGKLPHHRPGSWTYDDHDPHQLLLKMMRLKWQNAQMAGSVDESCAEIENLPFTVFTKTADGTALEAALYLAGGCNTVSLSMIMRDYEPMSYHEGHFRALAKNKAHYRMLSDYVAFSIDNGIKVYSPYTTWKRPLVKGVDKPFAWADEYYHAGLELLRDGIPYACDECENPVYLLHESLAAVITKEDLAYLSAKPVLLSGSTIDILINRGFGGFFDLRVTELERIRFHEVFTAHPINEGFEHKTWRTSSAKPCFVLLCGENDEIFSEYGSVALPSTQGHGAACAIIRAKGNGRWAVFGTGLSDANLSFDKRSQILNAIDDISSRSPAARHLSRCQSVLQPRVDQNGKTVCVSIVNCTVSHYGPTELLIRRPRSEHFFFMSEDRREDELEYRIENGEYVVKVPAIDPWRVGTVFIR